LPLSFLFPSSFLPSSLSFFLLFSPPLSSFLSSFFFSLSLPFFFSPSLPFFFPPSVFRSSSLAVSAPPSCCHSPFP
ncbi:hypothetical protein ACXWR7_10810, partial [Streptococcus pyogenes]